MNLGNGDLCVVAVLPTPRGRDRSPCAATDRLGAATDSREELGGGKVVPQVESELVCEEMENEVTAEESQAFLDGLPYDIVSALLAAKELELTEITSLEEIRNSRTRKVSRRTGIHGESQLK